MCEGDAMTTFLQLNLQQPDKKPEDANLPNPQDTTPNPIEEGKKLNRMANRIAHKAAKVYGRSGSGLFSK
jgi:hypothetical protein